MLNWPSMLSMSTRLPSEMPSCSASQGLIVMIRNWSSEVAMRPAAAASAAPPAAGSGQLAVSGRKSLPAHCPLPTD